MIHHCSSINRISYVSTKESSVSKMNVLSMALSGVYAYKQSSFETGYNMSKVRSYKGEAQEISVLC